MKKLHGILWGIALIALGIVLGINVLGIADIEIFFDGWWTLFIIIPCLMGLFTKGDKMGNIFGLLLGVGLLLAAQGVFSFDLFWKLLIPAIIVVIGVRIIFGTIFRKSHKNKELGSRANGEKMNFVLFAGTDLDYANQVFEYGKYTAIFGGIDAHLENAIIEHDVTIDASAVFGGVNIYLPENVNVKVSSAYIFGGVGNERKGKEYIAGAPTVYINASGIFGGVDVM